MGSCNGGGIKCSYWQWAYRKPELMHSPNVQYDLYGEKRDHSSATAVELHRRRRLWELEVETKSHFAHAGIG